MTKRAKKSNCLPLGLRIQGPIDQTQVGDEPAILMPAEDNSGVLMGGKQRRCFFNTEEKTAEILVKIVDRRKRDLERPEIRGKPLRLRHQLSLIASQPSDQRDVRRESGRRVLTA